MTPYLTQHSRTLKIEGLVSIGLGILAIIIPTLFAIAIELLLGVLLLVGGVGTAIRSFHLKGFPGSSLSLFGGVLSALVGFLFLVRPMEGVVTLTLLLSILFFIQGGIEITMGLQHRQWTRWGWMLVSGLASIVIAGILFFGLPETAAWGIGLLVGIHLLFTGSWLWHLGREIQNTDHSGFVPSILF
ncbi:MAG: DUF308 domain-containing protein [Kiritimatiellia bacterium]